MVLQKGRSFFLRYHGLSGSTTCPLPGNYYGGPLLPMTSFILLIAKCWLIPLTFEQIFGDFYNVFHRSEVSQLQTEIAATESLIVKKQLKSRLQCARRMQGVFWKTGKRLKLAGIKVRDSEGQDTVVTSPQAVQLSLSSHWGPVYSKKPWDLNAAKTLMRIYRNRHTELIKGFAECSLPCKDNYIAIIKKVKR